MATVTFDTARNGGAMTKIQGMRAFPGRDWQPAPRPGETWEVEVTGYNTRETACFLAPVRKVDRERESKIAELVNTAKNHKTWREKTKNDRFMLPYNSIYREVAREFLDRVTWEWGLRGRMVTREGEQEFLAACEAAVEKAEVEIECIC